MPRSFDFERAPGYLMRRAQQWAVALFMEETADVDVTPVQFAMLHVLIAAPGTDQVTLARRVAFDEATSGSVIARLEAKGWVRREPDTIDRRRKLLWATSEGEAVAQSMKRAVRRAQKRIMSPLSGPEADQLMNLLDKLVSGHEETAARN
ncbi:MAG: MarR family transcriptional regulator [Burkholderiales bacterium]|jgi:DNA-binding MarR family transcriptional regulator|nr:MarR family transcriptional regulator [Burkholderiales bacterium]